MFAGTFSMRLRVGDGHALGQHQVEAAHPLEDVAQGKEGQGDVVGTEVGDDLEAGGHVGDDVVVGEHHALGLARRARRIDDGGQVGRLRLGGPGLHRARGPRTGPCGPRSRSLGQGQRPLARHVVHADHVLQRRGLGADLRDLGRLRFVGDEDRLGLAVVQDVEDLGRGQARVDGHVQRRRAQGGQVGVRPTPGGSRRGWRPGPRGRCRAPRSPMDSSSTARRNSSELMSRQAPSFL